MARIRVSVYGARRAGATDAIVLIRRAAGAAYRCLNPEGDAAVDVRLVDDLEIHLINRAHRNVDRPTDVLSFPLLDFYRGVPGFNRRQETALSGGVLLLGDIVLSVERARAQAVRYGHSFERECAYLTVHSMLHLLGFDHECKADKLVMRQNEEQIMDTLGLRR